MEGPVWLIDDMESALEIMKIFLEKNGYLTFTYNCPLKALHDLKQGHTPQLLITDYNMPGMLGTEFIEIVNSLIPNIPSIVITGNPGNVPSVIHNIPVIEKGNINFLKNLLFQINKCMMVSNKDFYSQTVVNKKIISHASALSKKKAFKNSEKSLLFSHKNYLNSNR